MVEAVRRWTLSTHVLSPSILSGERSQINHAHLLSISRPIDPFSYERLEGWRSLDS